jgi:hypothetical protein
MKKSIMFFCLVILPFSPYSEETTINQLTIKIEQLENRVTLLEKYIADTNNKEMHNMNVITSDKQIWRKLKKGMTQDNVRKLLGEPLTINSQVYTYWYYSNSVSHSFVIFDTDNKVMGWNEPE